MIDCFLANFRINPHNNDTLKVCLNTLSPSLYHHVLVSALYRIITQPRLAWWPQIDMLYSKSAELRSAGMKVCDLYNLYNRPLP